MKTTPSKQRVNVAVVGLGFMGLTHLRAYQTLRSARILAVCDAARQPVNGTIAGVGGNLHAADAIHLGKNLRTYTTITDLLDDPDIDLVDLCVPTALHEPLAIAALKAGKHVVCEKPLARDAAACRRILRAAENAKGFLMPAMCMRFWPGWSWLKDAIADQRYGKVLAARFRRVSESPAWSKGTYLDGGKSGGALLDLHIHDSDFVQFLFGLPTSVSSTGISHLSGAIDHVVTQYQVSSGAVVSAEGSWLMSQGHGFSMAYTVNFEHATADFDSSRGPEALKLFQSKRKPRIVRPKGPDGYAGELLHIIQSIQSGTPPTIVTPQDALNAVRICEAEEKSILTGKPIRIS